MEQPKKELIKEITDLFEDYEESYVPGEWENFVSQTRKKSFTFPTWMRVAAIICLMASVFAIVQWEHTKKEKLELTAIRKQPSHSKIDSAGTVESKSNQVLSSNHNILVTNGKKNKNTIHKLTDTSLPSIDTVDQNFSLVKIDGASNNHKISEIKSDLNETEIEAYRSQGFEQIAKSSSTDTLESRSGLTTAEFLKKESAIAGKANAGRSGNVSSKREKLAKWEFGLQIVPNATGAAINLGGGVVTAYRISERLSLSSGLSMVQLGSVGEVAPSTVSNSASAEVNTGFARFTGSKELLSIQSRVRAIDVPLGIIYQLNKSFYTSAGVSYFAVLNEKRNNIFKQTLPVAIQQTDPSNGMLYSLASLESQQIDEPSSNNPLSGNSYLGFFNFSVGRRQKISSQYQIQVEPFIKVPIGKLSSQELNLLNSGVKFQFTF